MLLIQLRNILASLQKIRNTLWLHGGREWRQKGGGGTCCQVGEMVGDGIGDIVAVVDAGGAAQEHAGPTGYCCRMDGLSCGCRIQIQDVVPVIRKEISEQENVSAIRLRSLRSRFFPHQKHQ